MADDGTMVGPLSRSTNISPSHGNKEEENAKIPCTSSENVAADKPTAADRHWLPELLTYHFEPPLCDRVEPSTLTHISNETYRVSAVIFSMHEPLPLLTTSPTARSHDTPFHLLRRTMAHSYVRPGKWSQTIIVKLL
ncbi:hypothetical protein KSP40_PGU010772 [Platanthera guangdongensis]|uniref:Uncharacterized protein n=1 Tax=Platanthera guangdongensis TaxID=2320717 RepID=A0ABR2M7Z3_9ASPA